MSKIFILGFNENHPRGGLLDLLTTLATDETAPFGTAVTKDYVIKSTVLAKVVGRFPDFDRYQVVHMDMYGGILMVEHWKKAPFLALPSQAERDDDAIFENTNGDYVRREAIQSSCMTSVGYIPGQ